MVAVALILPLVLATCGHAKLTDDAERINNYGSCPLLKGRWGEDKWSFDTQPRGYTNLPSTEMPEIHDCDNPFPDANIYHKDETVIATYFDDSFNRTWEDGTKSAPYPLNLTYQEIVTLSEKETKSFDCPVTCYDCANLCR